MPNIINKKRIMPIRDKSSRAFTKELSDVPGNLFCMKSHKKIAVDQIRNLYLWDPLANILLKQKHAGSRIGFQHDDNCCTVQHICLNQTALGSTANNNEINIMNITYNI